MDAIQSEPTIAPARGASRRSYSLDFKHLIVAETKLPGVSVASVARAHGLNANVVFGWRKQIIGEQQALAAQQSQAAMLPVTVIDAAAQGDVGSSNTCVVEVKVRGGEIRISGLSAEDAMRFVLERIR